MQQITVSIKDIASCLCTFYNNGKANVMLIDDVLVKEEFRKKGYGTQLINKALNLARELKVDSIELVVNKDNEVAKNLYEKVGFKKTNKDYYRFILNKWTT
ncbi:MAG: GNAT family N-acetyltransferase [Candidatus Daviesbacteria bacterium]|nr:GNAT family N-acetyltransferase [Candidatus Daviesbacteria bacterium]